MSGVFPTDCSGWLPKVIEKDTSGFLMGLLQNSLEYQQDVLRFIES